LGGRGVMRHDDLTAFVEVPRRRAGLRGVLEG